MNDKEQTRVLVFPCGTEIALEIHRSLGLARAVELVGANSVSGDHGAHVFLHYYSGIPFVHEPECVPRLRELIRAQGISHIYPAHDDAVVALARHAEALGCPVITAPLATCELCRNKRATYARFSKLLRVPAVYDVAGEAPAFPVFVKPEAGQGSRGARRVDSALAWAAAREEDPTLLAMEYLPGPEYTVDCFTDRHGALRFAGPRERLRTANGISVHTRPVPPAEFWPIAETINQTTTMRGPWFFQVKRDKTGGPALLEIAPRVSGGMGLYRNLGVNLALLGLYDRMDMEVSVQPLDHDLEMNRALIARFTTGLRYRHVYMDLDDTLLCGDRVNTQAAAFLFQCRNLGIALRLLTRHAGDADETLARHALTGVFDEVITVPEGADKAAYITCRDALFIDDSFQERRRVRETLGIPVFAPDMIESLLDWRR